MKNSKECAIDNTLKALEQAIADRKIQMHGTQDQPRFSPMVSQLYFEILNKAGGYYAQMTKAWGQGKEMTQGVLNKVLQGVRQEPWGFLRLVAMYSFAIGFFLSLRQRKSSTGEKA